MSILEPYHSEKLLQDSQHEIMSITLTEVKIKYCMPNKKEYSYEWETSYETVGDQLGSNSF